MLRGPLHIAVLENDKEMVGVLLSYLADPNMIDVDSCTALHYAC